MTDFTDLQKAAQRGEPVTVLVDLEFKSLQSLDAGIMLALVQYAKDGDSHAAIQRVHAIYEKYGMTSVRNPHTADK